MMNWNTARQSRTRSRRRSRSAFTLIEMLVVIVIIGALITVSAPAIDGVLRSSRLTSTADNLRNYLSGAQQLAVAQNVEVEVRISETISASAIDRLPRVRTLRTYVLRSDSSSGTGAYVREGAPLKLDDAVAISAQPSLSSLLNRTFQSDPDEPQGSRYVSFHFFPDGSTDLPSGQPWFLTLLEDKHASAATAPANFVTIQVHPTSGKLRTFRP
ncbi:Verru_Chthon cassette protein D [Roseimicrobium sp. ORNL1]|uniref:Verru_Chthon cassette protein D n=1 Tax=Roseimicrobium sp. ORNL1 TaxID=2711231 RepID=UPI0013E0EC7A|nr:Verru_Chthon cassette protein D [Roseimicrobium sp. ORNL1]QIF05813.1 Verru_Chthon cassette protein D [Roseimicrobium sp. ORNL1]